MELGTLNKIDLREYWKHEARDFTGWLSKKDNLEILSQEIGIDIKLIKTEAEVGKYSVDILAEEETTGKKIIIENQLESTDHDHLGKLITYASGYDAEIVIWIVKDVNEEHRQAIDWLNEHTDETLNFFVINMELWQIDNSRYAPKFNTISKPNDWVKQIREYSSSLNLTDTNILQKEFWESFKEWAILNKTNLKLRKPHPQHWYDISIGTSEAHITLTINTKNNLLGCEIYIPDSKETYYKYYANKEKIESDIAESLEWLELPEKKASRIVLFTTGSLYKREEWEAYFKWLKLHAETFQRVFNKYK